MANWFADRSGGRDDESRPAGLRRGLLPPRRRQPPGPCRRRIYFHINIVKENLMLKTFRYVGIFKQKRFSYYESFFGSLNLI